MPQYVYTINGQRHIFEGPDPQSTGRFARRWAAQEAGRTPVTVADIQRRLGGTQSQFASDLGSRVNQDVADLTGSINDARAHPRDLMNAPKLLGAVARYVPNAFGLVPAAGVDQMTGPVVRGINARFGTHFDPRYATDQILNAAGFMLGGGESSAAEEAPTAAGGRAAPRVLLRGPAPQPRLTRSPEAAQVTTHVGNQPQPMAPRPPPDLTVAYEAPVLGDHVLGQNSDYENVVPLSEGFNFSHAQRMRSLEDLPEDIQDKYSSAINELILDPILDDPDYGGHNSADVEYIREELAKLAEEQRGEGGNARLADALDAANEDFRVMVNQQQPEMAKELGLTRPGDSIPSPSSSADPDVNQTGPRGELASFEQHVAPPASDIDENARNYINDLLENVPKDRLLAMMKAWKDVGEPANDNEHWAGKPTPPPILPKPQDFEPPTPLRDTMSPEEKEAWMKTAANDNAPRDSAEYLARYLPATWAPQLPDIWRPPQARRSGAGAGPSNAFADPVSLDWTVVPRPARPANGLNFNALRPPQWGPLGSVAAANQSLGPQPPQNSVNGPGD